MSVLLKTKADIATEKNKIEISKVSKFFQTGNSVIHVLDNININIKKGEFVAIVGSSGCGKSTLLRLIAGLDSDYEGTIKLDGEIIQKVGKDRGMVFQDHRLFPWMTVEENIEFGLDDVPRNNRKEITNYYIELMGLKGFEKSRPSQLSGGMSQRVAIARTLAKKPDVILLDEPFGALDALTRIQMQQEILRIREMEDATMILVTHDIDEAILLGDRVLVMSKKPGNVFRDIRLSLARPRDRNSTEFVRVRETIFNIFFSEFQVNKFEDYSI